MLMDVRLKTWENGASGIRDRSVENNTQMSPSLVTIDPAPERDGTTAPNQEAGRFLFFPRFNVGKTTFLLSFLLSLVFLGNG